MLLGQGQRLLRVGGVQRTDVLQRRQRAVAAAKRFASACVRLWCSAAGRQRRRKTHRVANAAASAA